MAETEGSDDTSESELLDKSLSVWKGAPGKEKLEIIPLDFYTASSLGQHDCVKVHIIRGEIDVNKRNKGGWTALMYACYIGHDNIVSLLLQSDVCANVRNYKGETPLMLAASCGNERVGFLLCNHEAELEAKDERGWTSLFHSTYSGHQNMVRFLLEQGANMNAVEPSLGMTPFMEAAAEGHEIILQLFLQHGVNVNAKAFNGDTARSLALINGNMKIVSLIDNHVMPITSLRAEAGLVSDLNSSRGAIAGVAGSAGGPSIRDGPEAIARLIDRTKDTTTLKKQPATVVPKGYVTFPDGDTNVEANKLSYRDVTSPINPEDYKLDSSGGRESFENEDDTNAFTKTGALTIKSSSGSSGGLAAAFGIIRREDSLDSDEFPHDSSCADSNRHGNSGDSSSDEEPALSNQNEGERTDININQSNCDASRILPADKPNIDNDKAVTVAKSNVYEIDKKKLKSRKSKEKLTTENVNEIKVLKNSVSEWVESVTDTVKVEHSGNDIPVVHAGNNIGLESVVGKDQITRETNNQATPDTVSRTDAKQPTTPNILHQQQTLQPDFQHQQHNHRNVKNPHSGEHVTKTPDPHYAYQSNLYDYNRHNSQITMRDNIQHSSQLFDQVANSVPAYGHRPNNDFLKQANKDLSDGNKDQVLGPRYETNIPSVSALNLLNTVNDGYKAISQQPNGNHSNQIVGNHGVPGYNGIPQSPTAPLQTPPPFSVPYGNYEMFPPAGQVTPSVTPTGHPVAPPGIGPSVGMYKGPAPVPAPMSLAPSDMPSQHIPNHQQQVISSNESFMDKMRECQPKDLATFLEQLGLSKHLATFDEQDVDLQVFLSLTDNDLKEIGIKLFGPRKKMTNGIARWHSKARIAIGELEQAYADRLEGEMQEMGVQLQLACEQLEKVKAQLAQEQQLRNVTESCLMEERTAWSHVQRVILDTRQQCEDFKDAVRKMTQYSTELKSRVPLESCNDGQQKRAIRGGGGATGAPGGHMTHKEMLSREQLPTEAVCRKVDYYMQEIHQLLNNVTSNTDRLLGRNTQMESPDTPYS